MNRNHMNMNLTNILRSRPLAVSELRGSAQYPEIDGVVFFYQTPRGALIVTEVTGLPVSRNACNSPIFAFHIHEGNSCTGNERDPFADAGMHDNPYHCPHPYHAGDMPPLFGANGYAFSAFLSDRFTVEEVIGKTVILHEAPDDFVTQPSGNAGAKMACGVIVKRVTRPL